VARFYLAGLAAGAESVTGWCLNARSHDFEAGDWGLLDNQDRPSGRSRMLAALAARLEAAYERTGSWSAAPPRAIVAVSPGAQALEAVEERGTVVPGRLAHDGAHGAALLAVRLLEGGMAAGMVPVAALPRAAGQRGDLLVLSHVVGWERETAARIAGFAASGGCVVLDATCGRKTLDGTLQRPWPGGLAEEIGLEVVDLETRPDGYELRLYGEPAGRWPLARIRAQLDPSAGWRAWEELRYAGDGEPCVWERPVGEGRIVVVRGMLGPAQVHGRSRAAARYILDRAGGAARGAVRPVGGHWATVALPVAVEYGTLTIVLAPERCEREGRALTLGARPGRYVELWTDMAVECGPDGELALGAEDGIALLWQP
jgi:hypothetical protein